jgi:hypothetical protein
MPETMIHEDQQLGIPLVLDPGLYLNVARDNLLWHYQAPKQNSDQQQWQHKRALGLNN